MSRQQWQIMETVDHVQQVQGLDDASEATSPRPRCVRVMICIGYSQPSPSFSQQSAFGGSAMCIAKIACVHPHSFLGTVLPPFVRNTCECL